MELHAGAVSGHADGGEHALTAAMVGLFAVQGDQLVFGGWATQLLLNGQESPLEFFSTNLLDETPKGRLARSRVAPAAFANAQGASLRLTEPARKFG